MLSEIAKTDGEASVRSAALGKLTDQAEIAEIARKDDDYQVRKNAVAKLTDRMALAGIAKTDTSYHVRWDAVKKLAGQNVLAGITRTDQSESVRRAAVENLPDLALLEEIAKNNTSERVRIDAAEQLKHTRAYGTVILTLDRVYRVEQWQLSKSLGLPKDTIRGLSDPVVRADRRDWEVAVVRLKVKAGPDYREQAQAVCSELVDVKGKSYSSPLKLRTVIPGGDCECPFAVPKGVELKTFRMGDAVFDLR